MTLVKRLRCRACGGPKVTPPRTAFVYCDWCGAFTDWDFRIANETAGSARPTPQYEALALYLKPRLEEARLRGDRAGYAATQRQLFEAHVAACRAAYSPRVGDARYRGAIVGYHVATKVIGDFDASLGARLAEVERAESTMRWLGQPEASPARPDRFWNLFGAFRAWQTAHFDVLARTGVVAIHPDRAPADLLARIETSAFVQRWLGRLEAREAERLLAETDLRGDYAEGAAFDVVDRRCGGCGAKVPVAVGARCVLCEDCGQLLEVAAAEIACPHCGSPASVPVGAGFFACPHCKAHVQRV